MRGMLAAAILCVFSGVGAAERANQPANQVPFDTTTWFEPTEPLRIVGPIHYVGTRDLGAYLLTTRAGHILIDGAMPQSAALIEASIRKLGYRPEDIRILLITHAHVDHVGTLAHFKKLTGARVEVMAADAGLLESGGKSDYLYSKVPMFQFAPVTADRVLADGDTVALGGMQLTARHTPGHTRGCTTWVTTVEEDKRSYRVVFPCSTSINPGTKLTGAGSYPGIADDYRRTFSVLASLQPDIFLAGHAGFFGLADKRERMAKEGVQAFVDPEGYRRLHAAKESAFEAAVIREQKAQSGDGGH